MDTSKVLSIASTMHTAQENRSVSDPNVPLGKPIVRGTRVPVYIFVGFVEVGMSPEEIVDDYPELTIEDLEAAIAYAACSPETIEVPKR